MTERQATDEEIDAPDWADDFLIELPPARSSCLSPTPKPFLDAAGNPVMRPGGSPKERVCPKEPIPLEGASGERANRGRHELISGAATPLDAVFKMLEAASMRLGKNIEALWQQCQDDAEQGNEVAQDAIEKLNAALRTFSRAPCSLDAYSESPAGTEEAIDALKDWSQLRKQRFGRTGPKPQTKPAEQLRLPTTEYMKDAMMSLCRGEFTPTDGKEAVFTQLGKAQLRIECDATGFDTMQAIKMLADYGPATMQTFLGLMGLWVESNRGASHETYFTARASDLMRYMRRKELTGGGYHTKDQMQKGREIYILSRTMIPQATRKTVNSKNGQRTVETITLDRLLHVQNVTVQRTLEAGQEVQSILEFRYHPNKEIHEMLCGDTPQFAEVSGKLLGYHPVKQKYHILLGFGLAFYERVNRRRNSPFHQIALTSLLQLAGIDVPKRNVERFLEGIQKTISDLSADGVIPGAQIGGTLGCRHTGRQNLEAATVISPRLLTTEQRGLSGSA